MHLSARPALRRRAAPHAAPGRPLAAILSLVACLLLAPAPAGASGQQVLDDCVAGKLGSSYSAADYRDALAEMPLDMAEYSPCVDEITLARDRALAAAASASAGKSGRGGAGSGGVRGTRASGAATGTPYAAGSPADDGFGASGADDGEVSAATTPTTPQPTLATEQVSDDAFLAMPTAGADGAGGDGGGPPILPIALSFSVIALTAARALLAWGRRPESLGDEADLGGAPAGPA